MMSKRETGEPTDWAAELRPRKLDEDLLKAAVTGNTTKERADNRRAIFNEHRELRRQQAADDARKKAETEAQKQLVNMAKNNAEAFAAAAAQFRAMMELCYPDLVKLCNQKEIPDCTELFPAAACLTPEGPGWMHPIPKGEEDGQTLVWSEEDMAWLPGEGGGEGAGNYGFLVHVEKVKVNNDEKDHVKVNLGTAQAWGGSVRVYNAADLGDAVDGYFVYAVLDLPEPTSDDVPYWHLNLHYDEMEDQDPDEEIWVPIAYIENIAEDPPEPEEGEEPEEVPPVWRVTQLHWGNIVIPATVNAVDVQTNPTAS